MMGADPLSARTGLPGNTNHVLEGALADLQTRSGLLNGAMGFATDGRKDGEGAGDGTGIPVWWDEASSSWRTYTTGAAAVS
jgi:hypothetical protein